MCDQRAMTKMSHPTARLYNAWASLAWIGVALALLASPASAQSPAEFFRGKTVSLFIGFGQAARTIYGRAWWRVI